MGKQSKRRSRQRYHDLLDDGDLFESMEMSGAGTSVGMPVVRLFILQLFSILLFSMPFLSDGGNKGKEIPRNRQPFEEKILPKLSDYLFRRIYRMSKHSFLKLHETLEPRLLEIFFPRGGGNRTVGASRYLIDTKNRLSIAIRFFAGADPYDIMQVHDVSLMSVYYSVWGVVDAINSTKSLAYHFPDHARQKEYAKGFQSNSGAMFDCIIGAIDGLVICTLMPSLEFCRSIECGQTNFRCHRKDKNGLNFQAICDHKRRFFWVEMKWPAATSDYMAWVTSGLHHALENNDVTKKILEGFTIIGDNAYVKRMFMATPLKGVHGGYQDAYNYYLTEQRVVIECAFGMLVHRWAILRAPLAIPTQKVAPLMESLVRLHNYCINENELDAIDVRSATYKNLQRNVYYSRQLGGMDQGVVSFDEAGRPVSILGHGHHFADADKSRYARYGSNMPITPMDQMIQHCKNKKLKRPQY